jgi:two-component system, NtrC family, sensor histidine kinase HydH
MEQMSPDGPGLEPVEQRASRLFHEQRDAVYRRTDRVFVWLMLAQWVFGIVVALTFSPYGWEGKVRATHVHVYSAVLLGALISSLPLILARTHPGAPVTRYVIACAQMLWSALLIHLSGGRIETHFHVFGSLAFLAFYRDWKVLVPATLTVSADHLVRGLFWPESVYGIANPESWRFLEHAFWVVFEDVVLVMSCVVGTREMKDIAHRRAEIEALSEREQQKSRALDRALRELAQSQETLVRTEKLAAVGQLAASVGHELRNPLAAVRNATTYIGKRLNGTAHDPKVPQFLGIIDRELTACTRIISDLLDFARERPLVLGPCPLAALVEEAIGLVPPARAKVVNDVPGDVCIPALDKDVFRKVLINLVQNATESIPADREGRVVVSADGGQSGPWRIIVEDNGAGMPEETVARVFEPLFTTKIKGTGLGLAIVANAVERHHGTIAVASRVGDGTRFSIELPPVAA